MGKKNRKKKQEKKAMSKEIEFRKISEQEVGLRTISSKETMKVSVEDIKVVIPVNVYQEILTCTQLLDDEINGLGLVKREGGNFIVTEIFLLDQEVSRAACDIKTDAFVKLMQELIAQGKNPSDIRFWWHSHNSMGTEWSSTDETTGKNFAGSEWLVSLVINHKGDVRARINFYQPVAFSFDHVEVVIQYPQVSIIDKCKEMIKSKVQVKQYATTVYDHTKSDTESDGQVRLFGSDNRSVISEDNEMEEGPFGDVVTMEKENVTLRWDKWQEEYHGYDRTSGERLTEKELEARLGFDYNSMAEEFRLHDTQPHTNYGGGFCHAGYEGGYGGGGYEGYC